MLNPTGTVAVLLWPTTSSLEGHAIQINGKTFNTRAREHPAEELGGTHVRDDDERRPAASPSGSSSTERPSR
jgi:hypothetical protein